ncbi:MAG TPA: MotA/TolQ/ExbB proton channel family protein [Kofleriaceae bacterium]|nr:MotA/TolQ/ExbB proton channel family protein [Kofleriaceae bacterium]
MLAEFVQGWGLTVLMCAIITLVFLGSMLAMYRELAWVKALTDHLGTQLAAGDDESPAEKRGASLVDETIRDESKSIVAARDPAWASKQVRGWQMRAQRLEPALAFWTDFLRQLGLLGTVLGLGLAMAVEKPDAASLLQPLSLAVWTTVAGLTFSILLNIQFAMQMAAWADACEKNIEAWDARRRRRRGTEEPH